MRLKCDGTRAETRFRLQAKRTSPFKSAGATFQSTAGSRGVRISGSNAGYTMFRGSVKSAAYPLHSPVSSSLPSRASPCTITFQLGSMWVKTGAVWASTLTSNLSGGLERVELYVHSPDMFMARTFILFCVTEIKCLSEVGTGF